MARRFEKQKGQSVLEYAVLLGVVVAVIIAGQIYFKRGVQGRWKEASDQIGEQFTTRQTHSIETRQLSAREEVTGTPDQIAASSWSQSKILTTAPVPITGDDGVGGIGTYRGHETTSKDFVGQTRGKTLGAHSTFDSGRLSEIQLFDEAGPPPESPGG